MSSAKGKFAKLVLTLFSVVVLWSAGLCGCGEEMQKERPAAHSEVVEARANFTYKGKPIPPFFLADFEGGPEMPDFWHQETGSRISAVTVDGLFLKGDGAYSNCKIIDPKEQGDWVRCEYTGMAGDAANKVWMKYKFLGTTPSGVTVLEYTIGDDGSAISPGVLFVRFEMQTVGVTKEDKRERLVMRFLGAECWGDRVYRDVTLDGNKLLLGPERSDMPGAKDSLEGKQTILLE